MWSTIHHSFPTSSLQVVNHALFSSFSDFVFKSLSLNLFVGLISFHFISPNFRNCGLLVCNRCSSRKAVVPKVDPNRISRVCDDCFKKLNAITAETLIQLEFEENADSANYSKLQEGVVCGLLKGTPSKVDKMLGMKSPSPLKFARKSNIICAKQEETETKEPEENLTAAQKLEQLTLATPNSWGYHLYNVSLRVLGSAHAATPSREYVRPPPKRFQC